MGSFADWIGDLPEVDTPFTGLEGRMIHGPNGQTVFFHAAEEVEVPPHSHGGQWGVVVWGRLHLTVEGETNIHEPGETYDIRSGQEHAALLETGTRVIDVFQDPDRYSSG